MFQWEEKLENLRKEFENRISELCRCVKPRVSFASSSSTRRENEQLDDLKTDLRKFSEKYYDDRNKLSDEFKLKLQLLEEEQNACRDMIEDDKELQSEHKKIILAQLQQLHEQELEALTSKHQLEILSEKEKIEKLELTIAEMQISLVAETDMKNRIEFLEKESLLLREEKVKLEMLLPHENIQVGTNESLRMDDSSMLESGFSSGHRSSETLKVATSSKTTESLDSEILQARKIGSPFMERDMQLTQQLDELTQKLTGIDRENRSRSFLESAQSLEVHHESGLR